MIDLTVVGAGPVGLVAAIHAAEQGLEVCIIEARSGEIDKACGEGLMPKALNHLSSIGVNPTGKNFYGISYTGANSYVEARFSGQPGRGVRRTTLHHALMVRATELGVKFIEGRVEDISQNESSIEVAGIKSRYLIGADGLHSTVREKLGFEVKSLKTKKNRYGIRQHFEIAPWSDLVEVYWLPKAELYVTPVDEKTIGIAILGSAGSDFNQIISEVPSLSAKLTGVNTASKLRGAGPLRQKVTKRTMGRALLVGDASGYVDALTGEGLQVGFAEAEAAVNAILQDKPESYEVVWRKITRSYRLRTSGLLWASSNNTIRPLIVPAAEKLPFIFKGIVNSLG